MYWGVFVVLSVLSFILGFERLWRFRNKPATLTQKSFLVILFSLGVASAAYGTMPLTAPFYNVGLGVWHALVGVLIGGLEMLVLALRREKIDRGAVRAVLWRSSVVTTLLVLTYIFGFAEAPPISNLSESAPRNFPVLVHLVIFPAYIIWGLMKVIDLCRRRFLQDIRRRPISAVALLMVALGSVGFVWVNGLISLSLVFGFYVDLDWLYAPSPIYVGLWVLGGGLLAVGDRVYEELVSLRMLARLKPLWRRVIRLLPEGYHLPVEHLPPSARLQRAYVEISDAICTLRMDAEHLDVQSLSSKLRRSEVVTDPEARTVSQILPARRTRREDIALIHDLAKAYRRNRVVGINSAV